MRPEQAIQAQILQYLRLKGIYAWKVNTAGIFVRARNTYIPSHAVGVSDILGILEHGRLLAIEVKSAKGVLSEPQRQFLEEVNRRGGIAFVARSIEDVDANLYAVNRTNHPKSPSQLAA